MDSGLTHTNISVNKSESVLIAEVLMRSLFLIIIFSYKKTSFHFIFYGKNAFALFF